MSSTFTSTSCTPYQSSPLAMRPAPTKHLPAPPSTPRHTAKLWDEYERRAVENARRRETTCGNSPMQSSHSQRNSSGTLLDIYRSYDASPSAAGSPQFNFDFPASAHHKSSPSASATTVAICKLCQQCINSASGVCETCTTKTVVLPLRSGESTPLLSPSCRNFASTDLAKLHKASASGTSTPTTPSSPTRRTHRTSTSTQLIDPPIRLSSLQPPPKLSEPSRPRKPSLTDPNEPFLRLRISRKPVYGGHRHNPSTPSTPPSTARSSTSSSRAGTRPSSLAPMTTPPQYSTSTANAAYRVHHSATPSELSTMYPYISHAAATPPSVCRSSYSPQAYSAQARESESSQNTANPTSAWDDWDSGEENDKAGLVGYWRGKKWRGSRGSLSGSSGRRDSAQDKEAAKEEGRRKRRGFVRVISCGGCERD